MKPRCDTPAKAGPRRRSLEQKILLIVRRYRAQERRLRKKRERDAANREAAPHHRWISLTCAFVFLAELMLPAMATAANTTTFDKANQDFAAGRFAQAAQGFEQVIAQQGNSTPVLFDLGNAWLKAGEPGRAILNYERALVLAPRDEAIARNLRLARQQAGLTAPEASTVEKAVGALSWDLLTWLGVGALMLLCAAILLGCIRPVLSRTALRTVMLGSAVTLAAVVTTLAFRWPELDRAVILTSNTPARIAPAEAAGVSFKLPAGEIVHAEKTHGAFMLVRTAEGHSGWVSELQVARIMASDRVTDSAPHESAASADNSNA